jgi:hypothetical protein
MNNPRFVEMLEAICDVLQLLVQSVISAQRSINDRRSHQANPVGLVDTDIVQDISICHHLRDH